MFCRKQSQNRHEHSLRPSVILVGLILLFTGVTCFAGAPGKSGNKPPLVNNSQNPEWILGVDPETGLPEVRNRQNGFSWDSVPALPEQLNDYWITAFQSAFIIRYRNDSGGVDTVFTGQEACQKQVAQTSSGGNCTFRLKKHPLSFQAVYSLELGGRFRVRIPFRSIEDPQNTLLDIRVLPYFGSLPFQSKGYLVLPDGCGGIIKPHHPTKMYYASRIYGARFHWEITERRNRVLKLSDYANSRDRFFNLPLFGVVKGSQGLLGVVSQGQFQAELGAEITPITRETAASPRLIFREIIYDMFGRMLASPLQDRQDRIVDYYLLGAGEASYVGIAKKYRELLLASQGRPRTVNPKAAGAHTQYRLRLFMGVGEKYLDTTRLISFTSFRQAETILRDLYQTGIRELRVILSGWPSRGYRGDNPRHFPPDRRFGGNAGLKSLLRTGRDLGYTIGLQFDNSFTFKNSHGFKRGDTVKDVQGVPVDIGFGLQEYLFCPRIAWDRFLKSDMKMIRDLKVNGDLLFDGLNQGLFECYDKRHSLDNQAMASIIRSAFAAISGTNPVAVSSAPDYLGSTVTAIYDLPATCSEDCDEAIPLTPIIFHGMVPYSFEPLNVRSDGRREFLKMVEFGGVPNAFLTAEPVADMVYARYNLISSGKYTDWRVSLGNEYRIYQRDLRSLQTRAMIEHRSPAKNVYLTGYDDGTITIVNYGATDYVHKSAEGGPITVKALDWAVIGRKQD